MLSLGHELSARLPAELDVQIIGYLRDDLAALRSCSLVRKDWLSVARPHKFRKITLKYHDDVTRLLAVLDTCPELASLVKAIEFFPPVQFANLQGRPKSVRLRSMITHDVESLSRRKPVLYGLVRIEDTKSTRLVVTTIQRFKSATKLSFIACHIFLRDFMAALGAMSGLQDLVIQHCDIILGSAARLAAAPSTCLPVQLRHVTIDPAPPAFCVIGGTYLAPICFRGAGGAPSMQTRSLYLVYTSISTMRTGTWALGVLSETLEEVSITFDLLGEAITSLHACE